MNKTIRNTEVETVIKNLPQDKSPRPDGFTGEFHKTLRRELNLSFQTLPKTCRGKHSSIFLFYVILRCHNHTDGKTRHWYLSLFLSLSLSLTHTHKLQVNITDNIGTKILHKIIANRIQEHNKKDHTPWSSWVYSRVQEFLDICKSINMIHYFNKLKAKTIWQFQ